FPKKQQKVLNVIDAQTIVIHLDDERLSWLEGEVLSFERNLHMDSGYAERIVHWISPGGKEVKIHFRRIVSFVTKELFAIDIRIEPVTPVNEIKIVSTINGDVTNFVDASDPRVASGHARRLHVSEARHEDGIAVVRDTTYETELDVACVSFSTVQAESLEVTGLPSEHTLEDTYLCSGSEPVRFTKYAIYTDTVRHGEAVTERGHELLEQVRGMSFEDLLAEQKQYMDEFWADSDIVIEGDQRVQEGIRFNLYQLLQSVGKDPASNIAAKGLSGEGYEGHYFWDTEIYIFPV